MTSPATQCACSFCSGVGACIKCSGTGKRTIRKGTFKWKQVIQCYACDGTGDCDLCKGSGEHHLN